MEALTLGAPFLLGLLGSTHCLGMCSAFVVCVRSHTPLWHAGRLASYMLLGLVAGRAFQGGGAFALALAGGMMLLMGAGMVGWVHPRLKSLPLARLLGRLLARPSGRTAALLGGLTGLLPCGLLYAAVIQSGASGHGALGMAAFWAGTLPALLLVGVLSQRLPNWWPKVAGAMVMLMGLGLWWKAAFPPSCCH